MEPPPGTPEAPEAGVVDGLAWIGWPGAAGPPLVALHGIGGNACAFVELAARLPGRRLVALDLRGRGASTQAGRVGLRAHAADVLRVVDALGLDRPVLLGHSFGAYVAAHAGAGARAGSLRGLVLLDGGVWPPWAIPLDLAEAALATSIERLDRTFADVSEYAAYWTASPLGLAATPARVAELARDLVPARGGRYRPAVRRDVYRHDLRDLCLDPERNALLERADLPVLLVRTPLGPDGQAGTAVVPDAAVEAIRGSLRHFQLLDLPGASHYDLLTGAAGARVAAAIAAWLDALEPPDQDPAGSSPRSSPSSLR